MGGGTAASQNGDPILAFVAVITFGIATAVATMVFVAISQRFRSRQ